mgnify:CR=1 FL=1
MNNKINKLLEKWRIAPEDINALQNYGDIEIEFTADGKLIYTIHDKNKEKNIFLKYQIDNDVIITDQPSLPRVERTHYLLTSDGRLILEFNREKSTYIRISNGSM